MKHKHKPLMKRVGFSTKHHVLRGIFHLDDFLKGNKTRYKIKKGR